MAATERAVAVGCGLDNLGSTCYLNAVMQAVAHSPALLGAVVSGRVRMDLPVRVTLQRLLCHMAALPPPAGLPPSPSPREAVVRLIAELVPHMQRAGMVSGSSLRACCRVQQDAHEMYCLLVDLLRCGESVGDAEHAQGRVVWPEVDEVLCGSLQQAVRCEACGTTSAHRQRFTTLPLALDSEAAPGSSPQSINSLLNSHFAAERLPGYACDTCACPRSAACIMRLWQLPALLVLCIKRFEADGRACRTAVQVCPSLSEATIRRWTVRGSPADEQLERRRHARCVGRPSAASPQGALYQLVAVVCHKGHSQHGGHYFALVRRQGTWHLCDDDSEAAPADVESFASTLGYLLFYQAAFCS